MRCSNPRRGFREKSHRLPRRLDFARPVPYNQNERLAPKEDDKKIAGQSKGPRGVFITFEGIEGSGKTTHMAELGAYLRDEGLPVRLTREPGGTPIGDAIRGILLKPESSEMAPLTEFFLYQACRAQHIKEVVCPALDRGEILLCDRFTDATLAYQAYGRGLEREWVHRINGIAAAGLVPDLTVLLDCPVELGLRRSWERLRKEGKVTEESRFEEETVAFHQRVREGYLEMARQEPGRVKRVLSDRPAEAVREDVRGLVMPWIGRWRGGRRSSSR